MKILYYPQQPAGGQRVFHYLKNLGIEWTGDIHDDGITHIHHYNYLNRIDIPLIEFKAFREAGVQIINDTLLNIKKDYIDDVFYDIFGYSIRIDPTTHVGYCGIKTSQNAVHGLKMLECPIQPYEVDTIPRVSNNGEPHYRIYMKLIDTRISPTIIRDFRIVVMGGEIVYLFEKHLDSSCLAHPQKGKYFKAYGYKHMNKFFSEDEVKKIYQYIQRTNTNFAEIDILRSNYDGKMYIIDENPVPGGGVFNAMDNKDEVIQYLSECYKRCFI